MVAFVHLGFGTFTLTRSNLMSPRSVTYHQKLSIFRYLPDTTSVSEGHVAQICYQCHWVNRSFCTFRFWDIDIGQIESYEPSICYIPLEIVDFPVFAGHYFRKRKSRDSNLYIFRYFPDTTSVSGSYVTQICYQCHQVNGSFCTWLKFVTSVIGLMVAFVHLGFETFTLTRSNLMSLQSVTYHQKLSIFRYLPDTTSVSGSHVTQICYQCHWVNRSFFTFRFWDIHIGQIESYEPSICYIPLEIVHFPVFAGNYFRKRRSCGSNLLPV